MNPYLPMLVAASLLNVCWSQAEQPFYKDKTHFSEVFGHDKHYRIYLPDTYDPSGDAYPVIYFFHGWGGRYFKDDNAKLDYDRIAELVNAGKVILVMWDGSIEESEPRPYNVGGHDQVKCRIQYKDYFPELVQHIDSTYRTLTDRPHRGIIGYSMGGFMSFFLSGEYPHTVCAAVNMTGSPEFFIGYPGNHTLYSLRHTFGNLHGVNLRFHNSTAGQLVYLNREVHRGAFREHGLNYVYEEYEGGHRVDHPGEIAVFKEAFDFVLACFKNPPPRPDRWHHVDLYPEFDVWDYRISSNKDEPGFIELKNVSAAGMRIGTKKWLPDGPAIPGVNIDLLTAPVYEPDMEYTVLDYNLGAGSSSIRRMKSDPEGRIRLPVNHEAHHIGIYRKGASAEPVYLSYLADGGFLKPGTQEQLVVKALNKGATDPKGLTVRLFTDERNIKIKEPVIRKMEMPPGETVLLPFEVTASPVPPEDASPWRVRFNLEFTDDNDNRWTDDFDVMVLFDVPEFPDLRMDDGKDITGEGLVLGRGNGNGIPEPGERVMIYTGNHRTRLYYDDPHIIKSQEVLFDEMLPSIWPDGFTRSSIVKISNDCPDGYRARLLACYETKEHNPIKRTVHWGGIELQVRSD